MEKILPNVFYAEVYSITASNGLCMAIEKYSNLSFYIVSNHLYQKLKELDLVGNKGISFPISLERRGFLVWKRFHVYDEFGQDVGFFHSPYRNDDFYHQVAKIYS